MTRFLVLLTVLSAATASADARWGLRWKAPEVCIQPAELARKVEDRLGRAVFSGDAALRIDGVLEAGESPRWRARLTVVDEGGSIRGNREVTGDGECRALDENLALVVSVMVDPNATVAPSPPPPPPVAPPVVANTPVEPGVMVHLEANARTARLFRVTGKGTGTMWNPNGGTGTMTIEQYTAECVAPCSQRIARPADTFFVGGPDLTNSETFSLHLYPKGVHIRANVGPQGARMGGVMLMLFGGLLTAGGVGLIAVSSTSRGSTGSVGAIGAVMAGVGVLGFGAGIPLFRWGGTDVEFLPLD